MKVLYADSPDFQAEMRRIKGRGETFDESVMNVVDGIIKDVIARGDNALFEYALRFDGSVLDEHTVILTDQEKKEAFRCVEAADLEVIKCASNRIEKFHCNQKVDSWFTVDEEGTELGQMVRPLDSVCVYAPGGKAPYPSTVLMAAIPARVAGVKHIFLATPAKGGRVDPLIIVAAEISGIEKIFKIGGAQAIAAFAYGTHSIPKVDKIVGPGNIYVAAAKRMVYGTVGIDMIAGPSEVVVIADSSAPPSYVAADLLSQAEHDELASAVLFTAEKKLAEAVSDEIKQQLSHLSRRSIAEHSLNLYGGIVVTRDIEEAVMLANEFAPEHLELMVENPRELLGKIKNAGAIFIGSFTPEAIGDYIAGPNHILPTAQTARFSSPLGVYDFIKRTSILYFSSTSIVRYGERALQFASLEGLDAHGRSIEVRLDKEGNAKTQNS
ncbi:MAG: histidinol dehydrogenase [Syntrophales bacterium]|jgi:histidinol dehydrogenase|nr:histidinol dehydrogenase [Syntrophales bacterium]MDY0043328.1 histidinol dehydrogenase [Syntrophales bacterium]